jgi:hypothetical protein
MLARTASRFAAHAPLTRAIVCLVAAFVLGTTCAPQTALASRPHMADASGGMYANGDPDGGHGKPFDPGATTLGRASTGLVGGGEISPNTARVNQLRQPATGETHRPVVFSPVWAHASRSGFVSLLTWLASFARSWR